MSGDRTPRPPSTTDPRETPAGPDRRQFLRSVGLGGLGLAVVGATGLGQLAGAGHAAADPPSQWGKDPIWVGDEINRLYAQENGAPKANWHGACQQAQFYACYAVNGVQPTATYSRAVYARAASDKVSTDPNAAPAGSFSYWDWSDYGHVVTNIGNGYCLNTSSQVPAGAIVHDYGNGLYISTIAAEPLSNYWWSYTNGANGQLHIEPYVGG